MKKKVTIVVPVYNAEDYLERCLNSLVHQTLHRNNEAPYVILIIDDGSMDSSFEIAEHFKAQYPYLFTLRKQKNSGVAATRNYGIKHCDTTYIMFVDNDDYVESDYIERHLEVCEKKHADVVISGYRREDAHHELEQVILGETEWGKYRCITPWARIFRVSMLREGHIEFFRNNIGEDILFSLQVYSKTKAIETIRYVGYVWFYNNSSTSNTLHKGLKKECKFRSLINRLADLPVVENEFGKYYINKLVVWYLLYSGKDASTSRFVEEAEYLFDWLSRHDLFSSFSFLDSRIKDEPMRNRIAVVILNKIYRFHLLPLFARLYCDKND